MFKKIISSVLAIALFMSMGTTVFAEENEKVFKPIQVPSEEEFSKEENEKNLS